MNKESKNSPKRVARNCRRRSGFRPQFTAGDIGELTAKLIEVTGPDGTEAQAKAATCRLSRTVITAHACGAVSAKQAAGDLASSDEILASAGYDFTEAIVPEALMRFHASRGHDLDNEDDTEGENDSNPRLFSLARRLLDDVKAYETGKSEPAPPYLTWDAGLAWAACARVTDIAKEGDDVLGYTRIAAGLTWTRHDRIHGLCLELMRHILFERGQTVLAAALPRVARTDLGHDPIRDPWILAATLWGL